MANATPKEMYHTLVTPAGQSEWSHLVEADTKWKENGEYKTNLIVSRDEALAFISRLEAIKAAGLEFYKAEAEEEAKSKGRKAKVLNLCSQDPWVENEDGTFTFKLKRDAKRLKDDGSIQEFQVVLLDSAGKVVPDAGREKFKNLGNGSVIRAKVTAYPYNSPMIGVGVTMRLEKVQVINFVEYVAGGGVDNDFEAVDGGYLYTDGVDSDFAPGAGAPHQGAPASDNNGADLVV